MKQPSARFVLGRAAGGAILFSLPMLMTMEMWWLGFAMDRWRLILFLLVFFPLLVALSYVSGFEKTFLPIDDVVDALVAFAIATFTSLLVLGLMGVLNRQMPLSEVIGKVILQAVPGSIGALLARSQIGREEKERPPRANQYFLELMTMAAGAVFLAFNIAPTEEVQMIANQITPFHALGLIVMSLLLMDGFVYVANQGKTKAVTRDLPRWLGMVRHTIVGYAVAIAFSAFILWSFGKFEGVWIGEALRQAVVLAFPASIGAGAARLIV